MSRFYKEEVFSSSTQSPNMSSNGNNSQQQQQENTHEDVFIDGPSINSRNNDPNEQEIVEIQIEVASSSESLEGEEQQQQEQTQPSSSTLTNDTTTDNNNAIDRLQQPEQQQRKRRPSSPEVYGRKVTFTDNESSGISNSDSDGEGNNNANNKNNEGEENKSKTEPIKIPDRKSRSTTRRTNNSPRKIHSKKPQHLSVDPNSLDDRKMKKKNSMSNVNTPHSLISPMSSHAFGFLMNAPAIIDQHNATTAPVIVESDLRSSMSETPSTIGSPSAEETKSDVDLFDGNSTPKEIDITSPASPSSALSDPFASAIIDGKENIGRNIRDILKGMPSFEEAGKRFIVVGLGYECHRFDTAQHMLDHITGEDQDAESFWIDCQQSDASDVHALQKYFGIHGLTAEDMINNDSGEKWEVFDNYMFMIFTGQIADKVASNDYLPCHLNVLIFENCIITVHDRPIEGMDLLMNRIEKEFEIDAKHRKKLKHGKSIREKRDIIEKIRAEVTPRKNDSADVIRRRKSTTIPSPSWVFYAYLDAIIDVYIPKVDNLTRECDTLDEFTVSLNTTEKEDLLWRIALNKRRTIVLRKLLLPKQKMITYLVSSRVPLPFIDKEIQLYLRDVLDHLTYCCDRLDIARDSLHQSHTNYLTRVQIEIAQNAQKTDAFMNRLTVFASIFGPLSVLSGIWGMNVKVPGQDIDNLYWFFGICAFMVILSLALVMLLRKQLITM